MTYFGNSKRFIELAAEQTKSIIQRDEEDDLKLDKGIQVGINRGTIPNTPKQVYKEIDVLGKSPEQVTDSIITDLGEEVNKGCVIVLVGLSGTGKGTTVSKLSERLPNCVTWSNGNIFRAFTLLACTKAGQENIPLNSPALSKESIAEYSKMITFDYYENHGFDIKIEGLGLSHYVQNVKNTLLKSSQISKNIPTVAELTQGEAILIAKKAIDILKSRKMNVLLEGRQQTVDFIESPFRFCLKLSDKNVIGMRRIAQLIAAKTLEKVTIDNTKDINDALDESLKEF